MLRYIDECIIISSISMQYGQTIHNHRTKRNAYLMPRLCEWQQTNLGPWCMVLRNRPPVRHNVLLCCVYGLYALANEIDHPVVITYICVVCMGCML